MKKYLCLILALAMLLLPGCGNNQEDAAQTQMPTESTAPEETVPQWTTFPADRKLTARQYFVSDCQADEFVKTSGDVGQRVYPASITKLFSAYVAGQYLHKERSITVGASLDLVHAGSSVAGLKKGNKVTVRQLIEGMMLPSGNDAAYVLAVEAGRELAGKSVSTREAVDAFVAEMNRQAKILGMTDTKFANPDGIHSTEHYSTFRDLARLAVLALEDPVIMQYVATQQESLELSGNALQWENTNALIREDSPYYCPYAIGLKTGQTPSAGSCLLSAFQYEGRTLIVGVFGCPEVEDRFADTLQLFNETIGYQPFPGAVTTE